MTRNVDTLLPVTQLEILEAARLNYQTKLAEVERLISEESGQAGRKTSTPTAAAEDVTPARYGKRKKFSAATRAKMAEAQRKRWASNNTEREIAAVPPRKKRKLSVAGRKAIAEATRKRWAAYNAAKKKVA